MAKYKVKSATATFGSTAYKVRQVPAGKGQSSDPVDVTTLDDTVQRFIPGALITNKEIQLVVQGLTDNPTINEVDTLTITAVYNDGTTDTSKTINCGSCILKDVDPPNPDATGERAANWTLTFQPAGAEPDAS